MSTSFTRFDKRLFLKVHCYTIVYYIKFNCGSLTKFSLILEGLFLRSCDMAFDFQQWTTYTGPSLILEKLFSRSSFYHIACFSVIASGLHLDATNTSEIFLRKASIDAIMFNCGPCIWMLLLFWRTFSVGPVFHL